MKYAVYSASDHQWTKLSSQIWRIFYCIIARQLILFSKLCEMFGFIMTHLKLLFDLFHNFEEIHNFILCEMLYYCEVFYFILRDLVNEDNIFSLPRLIF